MKVADSVEAPETLGMSEIVEPAREGIGEVVEDNEAEGRRIMK